MYAFVGIGGFAIAVPVTAATVRGLTLREVQGLVGGGIHQSLGVVDIRISQDGRIG
jgi:hypothetical protein